MTRRPLLYAITAGLGPAGLPALQAAAHAGVDLIQIREKLLSTRELLAFCAQARAAASPSHARLLLNGRFDLALAAGLDGVHLPADGLPPARVRPLVPPGFLIGLSCHSPAEVAAAAAPDGPDFCVLGPVFPTPSKLALGPPLGLEALAQAARHPVPVLALGGITLVNAHACLAHGAAGLAAIRLFQHHPAAVVAALRPTGTVPSNCA
ncbi:MAG TPA: thiamine phosphate synthase [Terriglobales bacterium]|nr:thiamine phosphate synthase [Terriglobales bacterium]